MWCAIKIFILHCFAKSCGFLEDETGWNKRICWNVADRLIKINFREFMTRSKVQLCRHEKQTQIMSQTLLFSLLFILLLIKTTTSVGSMITLLIFWLNIRHGAKYIFALSFTSWRHVQRDLASCKLHCAK